MANPTDGDTHGISSLKLKLDKFIKQITLPDNEHV